MIPQTYTSKGGPHLGRSNLPRLQAELKRLGLHGMIVPHEDKYRNEYLPACSDRLLWLTGFSGSAVVLRDRAVLFVDGPCTVQVG